MIIRANKYDRFLTWCYIVSALIYSVFCMKILAKGLQIILSHQTYCILKLHTFGNGCRSKYEVTILDCGNLENSHACSFKVTVCDCSIRISQFCALWLCRTLKAMAPVSSSYPYNIYVCQNVTRWAKIRRFRKILICHKIVLKHIG